MNAGSCICSSVSQVCPLDDTRDAFCLAAVSVSSIPPELAQVSASGQLPVQDSIEGKGWGCSQALCVCSETWSMAQPRQNIYLFISLKLFLNLYLLQKKVFSMKSLYFHQIFSNWV